MRALLLERPVEYADGRRAWRLARLVEHLERWLPAEEARLTAARAQRRPRPGDEARWQALLGLYERLCQALAPRPVG